MQIDWWTFIAQIINLVILLFLLRKFLYIPVLKAVEARQKVIADELAQAAEERNKAKALSLEFARKNKQTERQKQKILAAAQVEAEKLSVKLCAEAEAEYQKQRMEWQQKLIKEQKTFVTAVQNLLAKHFTQFAESALRQMANVDLNNLVITHFMDKVKKMPAAQKAMLKQTLTESDMVEIHSAQPLDEAIAHDLEHFLRTELDLPKRIGFFISIKPELVCGLELQAKEQLISWHLADYMQEFNRQTDKEMQQLLKRSA